MLSVTCLTPRTCASPFLFYVKGIQANSSYRGNIMRPYSNELTQNHSTRIFNLNSSVDILTFNIPV